MLDNMRVYADKEFTKFPTCSECGGECILGYDDCFLIDDDYLCSQMCLEKFVGAQEV